MGWAGCHCNIMAAQQFLQYFSPSRILQTKSAIWDSNITKSTLVNVDTTRFISFPIFTCAYWSQNTPHTNTIAQFIMEFYTKEDNTWTEGNFRHIVKWWYNEKMKIAFLSLIKTSTSNKVAIFNCDAYGKWQCFIAWKTLYHILYPNHFNTNSSSPVGPTLLHGDIIQYQPQ